LICFKLCVIEILRFFNRIFLSIDPEDWRNRHIKLNSQKEQISISIFGTIVSFVSVAF
jgi:hypothetical protein